MSEKWIEYTHDEDASPGGSEKVCSVRDKPDTKLYPGRKRKNDTSMRMETRILQTRILSMSEQTGSQSYRVTVAWCFSMAVCQTLYLPSPLVPYSLEPVLKKNKKKHCASPVHRQKAFHLTERFIALRRGRALSLPYLPLTIHRPPIAAQE